MPTENTFRRVVTGLGADGRSQILFDDRVKLAGDDATRLGLVWRTDDLPARNEGGRDSAAGGFTLDMMRGTGSNFMLFEMQPGEEMLPPGMHATNTIDYLIMLRGPLELILDTGATMLQTGDVVVQRGILHGWRAPGPQSALTAVVAVAAEPVGAGGTL